MSTLSTSQTTFQPQLVPLQTVHRTEEVEALYHEDKSKGATEESPTDKYDPWDPPLPPPHPSIKALTSRHQFNMQYLRQIGSFLAKVRGTNIIVPDRTSQKIFLDTIRLLATHTDKVVDELCDYIKHGKLVPAAILLLAAQKHVRNLNGFDTIMDLIDDSKFSLGREECELESNRNSKAKKLKERKAHFDNALVLVKIILKAGEALDAYIQTHSKVSHEEVLGEVSAILQNYDVCPSGKRICIEDLDCCPYACPVPDGVLHKHGETSSMKAGETRSSTLEVKAKKAVIKEPRKGQNLWYERDQFLPIWRSVLTCRFIVKMFPSYAPEEEPLYNQHGGTRKKLNDQRLSEVRLGLLCSLESKPWKLASDRKIASAYQSRRPFGTAALTVLKMLKRAR